LSNLPTIHSALIIDLQSHDLMVPLLENRATGLLTIKGKPVIHYWCEHLSQLGVREVKIYVRYFPEQVRQYVGNGERWGINISVFSIPETIEAAKLLKFVQPAIDKLTLVACSSCLPVSGLTDWIEDKAFLAHDVSANNLPDIFSSLALLTDGDAQHLSSSVSAEVRLVAPDHVKILKTPLDLWETNMDAIRGDIHDPVPFGHDGEKGLFTEIGVSIKPGFKFSPVCSVGRHSIIGKNVFLGPDVVVGKNCIIEESCRIRRSVVMDDTFIGSHADLNNVIIDGNLIYQADVDLVTWIDDPAIIGSTAVKASGVKLHESLFALMLLILSIPFVLIHTLLSWATGKRAFVREDIFMPDGRDLVGRIRYDRMSVLSLNLSHRFWRKIPWLLQVMSGKMHIVGISPVKNKEAEFPLWAKGLIGIRPGMMNVSDVEGVMSLEEGIYVTDNYYMATRSFRNNLSLFARWIGGLFKTSKSHF
jgi:acetyltransferase-like isoleucine patch superfamily enzyme